MPALRVILARHRPLLTLATLSALALALEAGIRWR
jgi:hypothetical protein